jgi:hypothetical protein
MSAPKKKFEPSDVLAKAVSVLDSFAKDNSKEAIEARLKKAKEEELKAAKEAAFKEELLGYVKVGAGATSVVLVFLALRSLARARQLA